jgi:hypothetical protein
MDISKKHEMEYPLLHVISDGQHWYDNWGYKFERGSFGLKREAYEEALQTLSAESISCFFSNTSLQRRNLQNVIASYQFISNNSLITVQDLFMFVSSLLGSNHGHRAKSPVQNKLLVEPFHWTEEEIRDCTCKILRVLQDSRLEHWVSWRSLKDALCQSIQSPKLVDYCLEHLAGKTSSGKVVVSRTNEESNVVEYRSGLCKHK